MSGHSKWHTIKHKKAAVDAKRGKMFTKIIKELTVAARIGGGDPAGNPRLRSALAAARSANMPQDNIKRAIQKGTGELPGVSYEEFSLEGYGPGGVAVLIELMSDNRHRTVPEVRHVFTRHGGNLGENGCVGWMFEKKGLVQVDKKATSEDALLELALEAGAQDLTTGDETFDVLTPPDAFETVRQTFEQKGLNIVSAQLGMFPQNYVSLDRKKAEQAERLIEALEDLDDVQNVWANFETDEASAGAEA